MTIGRRFLLALGLSALSLTAACAPVANAPLAPSASPSPDFSATVSIPPPSSPSPAPTPQLSPTATAAPAITPTFAILRGMVLELSSCRYGPGAPYLYFTGLVKGSNLQVIGRREDAQWLYVEAIGGHSPCWVKATLMNVQGNLGSLEVYYPDQAPLPQSPYYPPTAVTKVVRTGNQVRVTWLDIPLRAGDEEDQYMQHYIIEVWRCQAGAVLFEPLATNDTSISFNDEPGCSQPSHGRIFVQEKHGFAGPAEIPWPPFAPDLTSTP